MVDLKKSPVRIESTIMFSWVCFKSSFLMIKSSFLMVKHHHFWWLNLLIHHFWWWNSVDQCRSLDAVGLTVLRQAALPGYGYGGYPEGGSNGYAPQRTAGQRFFLGFEEDLQSDGLTNSHFYGIWTTITGWWNISWNTPLKIIVTWSITVEIGKNSIIKNWRTGWESGYTL